MLGPCAICRREIRSGLGFSPPPFKSTAWTCSIVCAEIAQAMHGGEETQMTENEKLAQIEAGQAAGAYLDSIGKFDLGALSSEEWGMFLARLFEAYHAALVSICGADNKIPY